MRRRAVVAAVIIAAWGAGLALLIRQQYFRPAVERLADAALRVTPGVVYYAVMQGDRQVGFASSTIDTAATAITMVDYFVADLPIGGRARRATARSNATLSRGLRMRDFDLTLDSEGAPVHAQGSVEGDSVLVLGIVSGTDSAAAQRIPLTGPILLPTLVPIAVALGETPKVGKRYVLPMFDPSTMRPKDVGVDVRAETTFVVNDSAVFDSATARWHGIQPDTLRAWNIHTETGSGFTGWIDDQGRIVQTSMLGFTLRRLPYEVAFENWRNDSTAHADVTDDRDIMETTAIASNKRMDRRIDALKLHLSNVDLSGFDIEGQRQHLAGDVLTIGALSDSALTARYLLPRGREIDPANTRPEPLIQSDARAIVNLAYRIQGSKRDPRVVAERLNTWVHDSIQDRVTFGVPSALQVLQARTGDCNEHTQLYVALARALGLPARIAAGLAYVDGKFYYHAWPEVYLNDWVAVDPTFGQFPADAAHLRFTVGGLARQAELLRLMGNLKIDILSVNQTSHGSVARQ
jgi:transglutaminase-like putative cysteine protease